MKHLDTRMEMTLEPVKFSLRNLYNYFKPSKIGVSAKPTIPTFYKEANKLIDTNRVQGRNYTTQDISQLKRDVEQLEEMVEIPEYEDIDDYNSKLRTLTLKIAARAYIVNESVN